MEDKFRLRADKDNVRIDVYLSEKTFAAEVEGKRLIEEGHVRVGDKVPKSSFKVRRDIEIEGEIVAEGPSCSWPKTSPSASFMRTIIFS